jgi:hypothetical protein
MIKFFYVFNKDGEQIKNAIKRSDKRNDCMKKKETPIPSSLLSLFLELLLPP